MELCFIVLTPDALERGLVGRILSRMEDAGFRPDNIHQRRKGPLWVTEHFGQTVEAPILEFLTMGPCLSFIVGGSHACARVATLVGDIHTPGTIRCDFAIPPHYGCLMYSRTHDEAVRQFEAFHDDSTEQPNEVTES